MVRIKHEYFSNLRQQAVKKHEEALNLAFNKAREAVKLLECDIEVFASRPPHGNYAQGWNAQLQNDYQRLNELKKAANEAEELTKPEVYMIHPDFNWWVHQYERELYAPTAEDYVTEEDTEVSHKTQSEAVEVVE